MAERDSSHDTFVRVFARLNPEAFEASFQLWFKAFVSALAAQIIAIDGKTAKDSSDQEGGSQSFATGKSAWACEHRLVLRPCAVQSKSNEIRAIPVFLEQLALTGCIVSIDALGTYSEIA